MHECLSHIQRNLKKFSHVFLFSVSIFWPQEFEKMKNQIYQSRTISITEIDKILKYEDEESIPLLINLSDSWDTGTSRYAINRLFDFYTTTWFIPSDNQFLLPPTSILKKYLASSSPALRSAGCQIAAQWAAVDLIPQIDNLTQDPDYDTRVVCTEAFFALLGGNLPVSINPQKISQILQSGYHEIREIALKKIAEFKIKEGFDSVKMMTVDDSPETRILALSAISSINPSLSLPLIQTALNDEDPQVVTSAIEILGQIKTNESMEILETILSKSDKTQNQISAIKAIAEICTPRSINILLNFLDNPALSYEAIRGLVKCNKGGEENILKILSKTSNSSIRNSLFEIICSNPSEQCVTAITLLLKNETGMEQTLISYLDKFPSQRALINLLELAENGNEKIRIYALQAMNRYFEKFGFVSFSSDTILNALSDESESVRIEALKMALKWKIKGGEKIVRRLFNSNSLIERELAGLYLFATEEIFSNEILLQNLFELNEDVRIITAKTIFENPPAKCSEDLIKMTIRQKDFYDCSYSGCFERFVFAGSILKKCPDKKSERIIKEILEKGNEIESIFAGVAGLISSSETLMDTLIIKLEEAKKTEIEREISVRAWMVNNSRGKKLLQHLLSSNDPIARSGALLSILSSEAIPVKEKANYFLKAIDDEFDFVKVNALFGLSQIPEEAKKLEEKICEKINKPLNFYESIAALNLISTTGISCKIGYDSIGRFLLGKNEMLFQAALISAQKILEGKKLSDISPSLRFALVQCAISNKSEINRNICRQLTQLNPITAITEGKKNTPPFVASSTIKLLPKTKIDGFGGNYSNSITNIDLKKHILPFEFSIKPLENYPVYYPLFFIDSDMKIFSLFKNKVGFSGFDFLPDEKYTWADSIF